MAEENVIRISHETLDELTCSLVELWDKSDISIGIACSTPFVQEAVCGQLAGGLSIFYDPRKIGFVDCRNLGGVPEWESRGGPGVIAGDLSGRYEVVFMQNLEAAHEWQTIGLMKELYQALNEGSRVIATALLGFRENLASWVKGEDVVPWILVKVLADLTPRNQAWADTAESLISCDMWLREGTHELLLRAQSEELRPKVLRRTRRAVETASTPDDFFNSLQRITEEVKRCASIDASGGMIASLEHAVKLAGEGRLEEALECITAGPGKQAERSGELP